MLAPEMFGNVSLLELRKPWSRVGLIILRKKKERCWVWFQECSRNMHIVSPSGTEVIIGFSRTCFLKGKQREKVEC